MEQFVKWFRAQFGNTPEDLRPQHEILKDLAKAGERIAQLERELKEYRRIHYSWEAALYSKNAGENKYGF
jgi:hypothetical protein